MLWKLCWQLAGNRRGKSNKKFMSNIDYNKSSNTCPIRLREYKKINRRINNRKLSEIKDKEIPHLFEAFNY